MSPKKKALVLFGSPHSQGATARLLDSFLECLLPREGWEAEVADLYRLAPRPCTGCGACAREEACALHDLDPLDQALRASDLLVVASPVYNSSFPAPVKAWLDRTQRYYEARFSLGRRPPVEKHREAALLLAMGSRDGFAVEVCTRQLERAFSVMNTTLAGCAVWDRTDQGDQEWPAALERARALGERLARTPAPGPAGGGLSLRQVGEGSPELSRLLELYREAFPKNERSGLAPLLQDATGSGEVLSLWEGEDFAGLACALLTQRLAHLIYFAVDPARRGRGLGSRALAALGERYAGRPLVVDIEQPREGAANNAQRRRRKAFYLRGGLGETPVRYRWRGEPFELLATGPLSQEDWEAFWEELLGANPRLAVY